MPRRESLSSYPQSGPCPAWAYVSGSHGPGQFRLWWKTLILRMFDLNIYVKFTTLWIPFLGGSNHIFGLTDCCRPIARLQIGRAMRHSTQEIHVNPRRAWVHINIPQRNPNKSRFQSVHPAQEINPTCVTKPHPLRDSSRSVQNRA